MPKGDKLTMKMEAFCQEYIRNKGNASAAYRHAYNTTNMKEPDSVNRKAFELMENVKISARLHDLKEAIATKNEITIEYIVDGLQKVLKKADDKDDITNYRGAYMDLAKLCGLIIDKQQVTGTIKVDSPHKRGVVERFMDRNKE